MNDLRTAAQQALEALEAETAPTWECYGYHPKIYTAITALKAALAEPQEPVQELPWLRAIDEAMIDHHVGVADPADDYETAKRKLNNLLCHAQDIGAYFAKQAEPVQEPIGFANANHLQRLALGLYDYAEIYTDDSAGRIPVYAAPQRPAEPVQEPVPMWLTYDKASDVLTIHGKRYAASMFGHEGFLSPVGTMLRIEHSPHPETVTLTIVQPVQEPVQEPDHTYKLIGCVQHDCEECQRRTQRKPLSEEEIQNLDPLLPHVMFAQERIDFARAVEAAHGVKEEK